MIRPVRPDRLVGALAALLQGGLSTSTGVRSGAVVTPDHDALVDDDGALTYRELDALVDGVAAVLHDRGVREGDRVGILCRNHRGFVATMVAAVRMGADVVYLNTGFAGPQVDDATQREGVTLLVRDDDLAPCKVAATVSAGELVAVASAWSGPPAPASRRGGRHVILTSGTTGRPKGAARATGGSGRAIVGLLEAIPLRHGQRTMVAAPLFHVWGWSHFSLGLALRATCLLDRTSDPVRLAHRMVDDRADVLVTVPVLLRRILDADVALPALRLVALSGSPLPAGLARDAISRLGEVVYNLYGATEAGWISVAGPGDLHAAPGTAGRPVTGVSLRVVDADGRDVPPGSIGRIGVESDLMLEGYTDGSALRRDGGLLLLGDLGRVDDAGRLHVVGRADDMVVSGGENVYPSEVEDLLTAHPDVAEVAVVGVPDPEFGQRLRAVVVAVPGSSLAAEAVRDHVRADLARHKVPRDVVFVDALPRNAAGKVLRRELAQ